MAGVKRVAEPVENNPMDFIDLRHQIISSKLPSIYDVISVLLYNLKVLSFSLRESANLVYDEVVLFWFKAGIPTRKKQHCISAIENVYKRYRAIGKDVAKNNFQNIKQQFLSTCDDLFDIAHQNAETTASTESAQFLESQRMKGRPGCLRNTDDFVLTVERKSHKKCRLANEQIETVNLTENPCDIHSSDSIFDVDFENSLIPTVEFDDDDSISDTDCEDADATYCDPSQATKQNKIKFINSRLVSALDSCEISDRRAVHLLIATADALGHDVANLVISRSTIRRVRKENREQIAQRTKEDISV